MSDERFTIKPQDDYWAVVDNYNEDKVCIINGIHTEIEAIWLCDFMNEQQSIIEAKDSLLSILSKENEQLRKQIQNYEQLISNSYVGEEETLDGFVGKYVIWENELQRYRKKNKNELIKDE